MEKAQNTNGKYGELEERTFRFAESCRDFMKKLPRTVANIEYSKQLVRSSGSQAANYIEANEALSKKDFVHRVRICRKETKETCLWLRLCETNSSEALDREREVLIEEAVELRKIFNAIIEKSSIR